MPDRRLELGAVFPQTESSTDPIGLRAYTEGVEALGLDALFIADHVVGADPRHHGTDAPYSTRVPVHEPLTLIGFLAAVTSRVTLATGILVLPQRQTVLVAKQCAELDVLSGGRVRLGVGVGWNRIEYEALGEDFGTRGRRIDEQLEVLRLLWTHETVNYQGRWHRLDHIGLNPRPVQRPIPLWIGTGGSQTPAGPPRSVLERIATTAHGWSPNLPPGNQGKAIVDEVNSLRGVLAEGPPPLVLQGRIQVGGRSPDEWHRDVDAWLELGATSFLAETRNGGLGFPDQHLNVLEGFAELVRGL